LFSRSLAKIWTSNTPDVVLLFFCVVVVVVAVVDDASSAQRETVISFLSSLPSIQVVAPIRETGAQTLSIICNYFYGQPQCSALLSSLLHLLQHDGTWEIHHGALLTLKYTLNILKVNPAAFENRVDRKMCTCRRYLSKCVFHVYKQFDGVWLMNRTMLSQQLRLFYYRWSLSTKP
jgi:hypothetical protein